MGLGRVVCHIIKMSENLCGRRSAFSLAWRQVIQPTCAIHIALIDKIIQYSIEPPLYRDLNDQTIYCHKCYVLYTIDYCRIRMASRVLIVWVSMLRQTGSRDLFKYSNNNAKVEL